MGIDLPSGNFVKPMGMPELHTTANLYRPVPSSRFIDGVFIPNGQSQQIVSSLGHVFQECPPSSGACYGTVTNAIRILNAQAIENAAVSGQWNAHCILMHANMGITYDLQAIRSLLPATELFVSRPGSGSKWGRYAPRPVMRISGFWWTEKYGIKKRRLRKKRCFQRISRFQTRTGF